MGLRWTHNPQRVSSILTSGIRIQDDGYLLIDPSEGIPYVHQGGPWEEVIKTVTILDTGGTLTSLPDANKTTGVSCHKSSLGYHRWNQLMKELGPRIGLSQVGPKNSEDYTWEDYLKIREKIKKNPTTSWVVIHGTDNISFASTFLALCAKEQRTKIIVVASSRSMDRPTWQGGRLITCAIDLLKNIKKGTCYTLGYEDCYRLSLHSPLNVKKSHTYHKKCLDSSNSVTFLDTQKPRRYPRYTLPDITPNWNNPKREIIQYITPLSKVVDDGWIISYGMGNTPNNQDPARDIGTRVTNGPYNPLIYGGLSKNNDNEYKSIECRYLLDALS